MPSARCIRSVQDMFPRRRQPYVSPRQQTLRCFCVIELEKGQTERRTFGSYYVTHVRRQELIRNGYIQLDLVGNALLLRILGILGVGGDRACHARGIGGITKGRVGCAVGCAKDGLFEVCRAIHPTNLLHVGYPDVLPSRCGLDGECEEGDGVSENCEGSGEWDRCNRINCETYASPR